MRTIGRINARKARAEGAKKFTLFTTKSDVVFFSDPAAGEACLRL
jgi:hypothetical protein